MQTIYDPGVATERWQWYVIHCKHLFERRAALALEELFGVATYLPELRSTIRGHTQTTPYFPGYLFARVDLEEVAPNRINSAPGVVRLVAFDNQPQPIPAPAIQLIEQRLSELNAQGGMLAHSFRPGDTVRLKRGPLQGLEAVFVGPMKPIERVRILIDFLGQQREAEVDVVCLEGAIAPASHAHGRRTRGKGRPIRQH
jgi:transcriptional antiterminator RfaH